MLRRLTSAFTTPAATPPRSGSPEPSSSVNAADPNTHAGRVAVERDLANALREQGVPTTEEDCFACDASCDDDEQVGAQYETYPRGFDVDWDSDLLGSANPAPRNVSLIVGLTTVRIKPLH